MKTLMFNKLTDLQVVLATARQCKGNSKRLKTIVKQGFMCAKCCRVANAWSLNKHENQNHLFVSLYHVTPKGRRVLLTVDHVIPKSAGGASSSSTNQIVLCEKCNSSKGAAIAYSDLATKELLWYHRSLTLREFDQALTKMAAA